MQLQPYCVDGGNLLAHQFKDRTADVAGDALIRRGAPKPVAQKGVVEALAAGEAVEGGHQQLLWQRL